MIHETFTVNGHPDLDIRVESGRVEIREGEPGTVDVKVDTKTPGFIVEQRGNSILVSSDKNTSWLSRGSAYVVVETTPGSDLRVGVASAPVTTQLPLGKVEIKTASGDVELQHVESAEIKTASGDVDITSIDRSLRLTTASGDLRISEHAGGSVVVSTASGDVHIEHSDASIEMNTASGDAYIAHFEGRSANFKAMSGDIDVGIPPRTDVALDVTLLSGKLRVPDAEPRQESPVRQMSIRAKTVSGDFTITRV